MSRQRRSIVRLLFSFATVVPLFASCDRHFVVPEANWSAGTREHVISVNADERRYLLHVPDAPRRNRLGIVVAYPLVVVLHGSGADGETVREQSGMDKLADSLHFVVAYPYGATRFFGLGSDWNAGTCCGNSARSNVNDIGFVKGVVAEVSNHATIDARRVYVAGFSDGARMAYRMGCDAATIVAAIGVVSGSLVDTSCAPARPVPMIAFHGTADSEVDYDENVQTPPPRPFLPSSAGMPQSVRFWAAENQCQRVTVRRESPHVTRAQFGGCPRAEVVFYSIDSGAHAWPGGAKDGSDGFEPTTEIRASDAMIAFFLRHALQ